MKTFKQFLAETDPSHQWFSFAVDQYEVHILFEATTENVITEARHKGVPLGGRYSVQLHKAHSPVGQEHIHVYARNNQLFALNKDGSAHDSSHQTRIPNKVANAIQSAFPQFTLPPGNFIESAPFLISMSVESQLILG
jgi:hypothetical protein